MRIRQVVFLKYQTFKAIDCNVTNLEQVDRVRLFVRPSSAYFTFGNSIRKDVAASLLRGGIVTCVCLSRSLERNIALHVRLLVASCLSKMDLRTFLVSPRFPSDSRGVAHQFEMVVWGDKLFK